MAGQIQRQENFTITDVETLKVIADSRRMNILHLFAKPRTTKEIAEAMQTTPTKLYYHINLLEKHNLIQVVETNVVSGIIEKKYQATAHNYNVDKNLLSIETPNNKQIENMLEVIFDSAKSDIRRGIKAGLVSMDNNKKDEFRNQVIGRVALWITPDQAMEVSERLHEIMQEVQARNEDDQENEKEDLKPYGLTLAFYPIAMTDQD